MRRFLVIALLLLCLPMVGEGQSIKYHPQSGGSTDWNPNAPVIWDEFCGGSTTTGYIGQSGFNSAGTTIAVSASVLDRPCVVLIGMAASATGGMFTPVNFMMNLGNVDTAEWWVSYPTGANNPHGRVGFIGGAVSAAPATPSVYFEHLSTDTNWFAVTRTGADPNYTRIDTNVAYAADTYFKLRISRPAASTWQFYINNSLVATAASTIPSESAAVFAAFQMTTTGTSLSGAIDYFWMRLRTSR